jgi:hypothetical protein
MAETPETSEFTAAFERIAARQASSSAESLTPEAAARSCAWAEVRGDWLRPLSDADVTGAAAQATTVHACRPSNRGFLPMTLDVCMELLDRTGREIRADNFGETRSTSAVDWHHPLVVRRRNIRR